MWSTAGRDLPPCSDGAGTHQGGPLTRVRRLLVFLHRLCWAAGHWLGIAQAFDWGSGCHMLASLATINAPHWGELADLGVSGHGFSHSLVGYPQYRNPTAQPESPKYFSKASGFLSGKKICSWLSIFRHFMSTSNLQEQGDVRRLQLPCWSRRGQTYRVGPVSTLYCSTSFSEPSNPLSSCLSLETAGRNKCKCFCKQTQIRLKCNCSVTVTCLSLFQCL